MDDKRLQHQWQNLHHSEFVYGMSAGLISVFVTFPINKIIFRQNIWGFNIRSAIKQLRAEGIGYLYRGIGPPLTIKPLTSSLMFGTYDEFYRKFSNDQNVGVNYNVRASLIASLLSGTIETLIVTPFERIQTILQDGRFNNQYRNMFDTFFKLHHFGLGEYYRGFNITIIRNVPSTFLYFYCLNIYEQQKDETTKMNEFFRKFIIGSLIGSLISTLVYPMNEIRIRQQAVICGTKHLNIRLAYRQLLEERNQFNFQSSNPLFAGIYLNLIRSFLHWGCLTAMIDLIRNNI